MASFDLTVRNGTLVTANETSRGDLGIAGGRIVAVAEKLPAGTRDIDASGRLVMPGGIDSHCHVEQLSSMGMMCADDFYSATVSAAFGGTTTILPFACQHRGDSLLDVVADYERRAREKSVIDYGFHLIVSDPTQQAMNEHLPALIRRGMTSFKVYMTYDRLKLDDYQLLDVLSLADREGALVMVHAENNDMIRWIAKRLLERGHVAPRFHVVSHDPLAEAEAAHRARVGYRGCTRDPRGAVARRPGVCGDVPAIPLPHGRRRRPARTRGRDVLLQPAAARRRVAASDLGRARERHVRGLFLRSRAVPLRRVGQAAEGRSHDIQGHGEWRARH
jgi:hypothetical protein